MLGASGWSGILVSPLSLVGKGTSEVVVFPDCFVRVG